jgi:uncharacterized linocin/CFP29 family protein
MAESDRQLQWTDDQWNRVHQVVYEEARKARVAGSFLPLYGPLGPDATYVTKEELTYERSTTEGVPERISINNTETQPLLTLEILVSLRASQVADPELVSALAAFRRAANVLARLEDTIIFNGKPTDKEIREAAQGRTKNNKRKGNKKDKLPKVSDAAAGFQNLPPIFRVTGANSAYGLLEKSDDLEARDRDAEGGELLVSNVSSAIGQLEAEGHLGPFACVLDQSLFSTAQTPSAGSMVLPQDRILPFLGGGALVRSSVLPMDTGMIVASGGAPIDLVVATDVSVKFLQLTLEPRFVFRVYEKLALRVKEEHAIVRI